MKARVWWCHENSHGRPRCGVQCQVCEGDDHDEESMAEQLRAVVRADDLGRAARVAREALVGDMPCTVCGTPADKHGTFPTCATHPYTADGNCQHVIGARCVGAECKNGCVRALGAKEVLPARGNTICNPHADAPHGFNRKASYDSGRYVCDCEGWMPPYCVPVRPTPPPSRLVREDAYVKPPATCGVPDGQEGQPVATTATTADAQAFCEWMAQFPEHSERDQIKMFAAYRAGIERASGVKGGEGQQ